MCNNNEFLWANIEQASYYMEHILTAVWMLDKFQAKAFLLSSFFALFVSARFGYNFFFFLVKSGLFTAIVTFKFSSKCHIK